VIYFIGNSNEKTESLDVLRRKLLKNSRLLLSLFHERLALGRSIGRVKRARALDLRDWAQELHVLRKLSVSDPIEERFFNILFELTIMSERLEEQDKSDISFTGTGELQEMLAESICLPGDRILTDASVDIPFIQKAVRKGAHVVKEDCGIFDLLIRISVKPEDNSVKIWNLSSRDKTTPHERSDKPRVIKLEVRA
jgi:chorismate mutase